MADKVIAVPQEELFQVIDLMEDYRSTCYYFVKEEAQVGSTNLLTDLCEFYAACERVKERVLKVMQKTVDSRGARIPENAIVVEDLDYLMITELLVGIMELEQLLTTQNVSLKKH